MTSEPLAPACLCLPGSGMACSPTSVFPCEFWGPSSVPQACSEKLKYRAVSLTLSVLRHCGSEFGDAASKAVTQAKPKIPTEVHKKGVL